MFVSGPKVMDKEMYPLAWSSGKTVHVRTAAVSEEPLDILSYKGDMPLKTLLGGPNMYIVYRDNYHECEGGDD